MTHLFLAGTLLPQALKILPMQLTREQVIQWAGYVLLLGGGLFVFRGLLANEWITAIGLILAIGWIGLIARWTGILGALRG